jgi:hypothetical protein
MDFFWPNEVNLKTYLRASEKTRVPRAVLVLKILLVVRMHHFEVELAAIDTGSTIYRPARRRNLTFIPGHLYSYSGWHQLRKKRDKLKEVTVIGVVRDVVDHIVDSYHVTF